MPPPQPPSSVFHSATSALFAASDPEVDERADAFFSDEHLEPLEEIAAFAQEPPADPPAPPTGGMTPPAFANRLIKWPEPFRSVVYLGENPSHPRRRKGVTLAFSPAGVTAVSSGFSAWKHHIGWDEVTELEFQGADEVKFTYDHRIDVNATAAIVGLERRHGDGVRDQESPPGDVAIDDGADHERREGASGQHPRQPIPSGSERPNSDGAMRRAANVPGCPDRSPSCASWACRDRGSRRSAPLLAARLGIPLRRPRPSHRRRRGRRRRRRSSRARASRGSAARERDALAALRRTGRARAWCRRAAAS